MNLIFGPFRTICVTPPNRHVLFGALPPPLPKTPLSSPLSPPPNRRCGVPEVEDLQRREGRDAGGEGGGPGVADLIVAAMCVGGQ